MSSLQELRAVQLSFGGVLKENNILKEKMDAFHGIFENVGRVSGEFEDVKREIEESGNQAQDQVSGLKKSSEEVQERFSQIQSTFDDFQVSVSEIKANVADL